MASTKASTLSRTEIKKLAKFRAGLILESVVNDWTPEDLIEKYGQATVDLIAGEIGTLAHRLMEQG